MIETGKDYRIRELRRDDEPFIYSTWCQGFYYGGSTWHTLIPMDKFMLGYHQYVQSILAKEGVTVSVACLADEPNVIIGYSVHSPDKLFWIYVKAPFRRLGVANALLKGKDIHRATNLTKLGASLLPTTWRVEL